METGEDRKCFQENSLMRHGTGIICRGPSTPTQMRKNRAHWGPRLALTRSSLGFGQDDKVLAVWLRLAFRDGFSPPCCGDVNLEEEDGTSAKAQ
jgi:hypothetical protein